MPGRAPILADLAARYGAPHELTARQDATPAGAGDGPVLYGIDVSEHQGVVDWPAVAASGISFVVIKALEGTTYHDPRWAVNLAGAERAGIPIVGAYHFLTATSSAVTQADAFCAVAPPDVLHALDVEAPGPLDVHGWVQRYREHHPTHPLLIYTGKYLWSQRAQVPYTGGDIGPLWTAGAVPGAYVPGVDESPARSYARVGAQNGGVPYQGWDTWTLMQHSESCRVPGVPTRVDANAYRGTHTQLTALTGQEPPDVPLTDADAAKVAAAVHGQQLYRATWTDANGTHPLTIADALLAAYRRQFPTADQVAAAVKAALTSIPAGTTTLDDPTITKVAKAVWDEGVARLAG